MDFVALGNLGIGNLRSVFGRGARGETLAHGRHMGRTIEGVREAGLRTVVDLRTADHNGKLSRRCAEVGLAYWHLPVDARTVGPEALSAVLPRLFRILDGDGFYLSCQQGLHRTDIALALYYFFHAPDEIPEMVGHRTKGFLRCDDIMRRINAMRPFFPETDESAFAERRKRFLAFNRVFPAGDAQDERKPAAIRQTKTEEIK